MTVNRFAVPGNTLIGIGHLAAKSTRVPQDAVEHSKTLQCRRTFSMNDKARAAISIPIQ